MNALLLITFLQLAQCSLIRQNILYSISDAIGNSLSAIHIRTAPDWGLGIEELTHRHGYNIDAHEVTTEDGYILKIHRLSHDSKNISASKRPVVLLMHPLSSSSRMWVYVGPKSLGYALVDAGYDVWMGNARGTRYGRMHVKLDPNNDPDFWNFSFEEMGYYDLPSMIDYVLRETRTQKLIYIGYSQGNTAFFDMASRRPEYNGKIRVAVAAGPMVFTSGALKYNILLTIASIVIKLFGLQEMFRPGPLMPQAGRIFCSEERINPCVFLSGSPTLFDPKMMPMLACTSPEGFSSKMLLHYRQLFRSGKFQRYNYGFFGNFAKYRQHSAPNIDVSSVTAPVALFYAPNDGYAHPEKVRQLANVLPNVNFMYEIKNKHFNHQDFAISKYRDVLFNAPLIRYLDSVVHTSVDVS